MNVTGTDVIAGLSSIGSPYMHEFLYSMAGHVGTTVSAMIHFFPLTPDGVPFEDLLMPSFHM